MRGSDYPVLALDLSKNDLEDAVGNLKDKTEFALAGRQIFPRSVTGLKIIKSDVEAAYSFIEVDQDSIEVNEFNYEVFRACYFQ